MSKIAGAVHFSDGLFFNNGMHKKSDTAGWVVNPINAQAV
jgi:hypothetical protein